jgi:hypothetical protein
MYEILRQLWRITEMRDGSVYKTEYVEDVWIDWNGELPYPVAPKGYVYGTIRNPKVMPIRNKEE